MAQDPDSPTADIVLGGSTDVVVSKIKFTATNEQWTINKLRVKLNTAGSEGSVNSITIAPEGGTAKTSYLSTTGGVSYVNFTDVGWIIPAGTAKVLTIKADLKALDQSYAETGREIKLGVMDATGFEAVGTSQATITDTDAAADIYGNAMSLRKSRPTVTRVALESAVLGDGSATLFKANIAADAKGSITIKKLSFDVAPSDNSGGATLTLNTWKLYDSVDLNTPIAGSWSDGTTTSTDGTGLAVTANKTMAIEFTNEKEIAAGASKTFILKATVAGSVLYDSVTAKLGNTSDTAAVAVAGLADHDAQLVQLGGGTAVSFLWSDKARGINHLEAYQNTVKDWFNGYLVKVLPSESSTLTK